MSTQGGTQEGFRCVYVLHRLPKFMCTLFHNDTRGGLVEMISGEGGLREMMIGGDGWDTRV